MKIAKLGLGVFFAFCVLRMVPVCVSEVMGSRSITVGLTKSGAAIGVMAMFLVISVVSFQMLLGNRPGKRTRTIPPLKAKPCSWPWSLTAPMAASAASGHCLVNSPDDW